MSSTLICIGSRTGSRDGLPFYFQLYLVSVIPYLGNRSRPTSTSATLARERLVARASDYLLLYLQALMAVFLLVFRLLAICW